MVWLNGSVLHDPPEKIYECRVCQISVIKHANGDYDVREIGDKQPATAN